MPQQCSSRRVCFRFTRSHATTPDCSCTSVGLYCGPLHVPNNGTSGPATHQRHPRVRGGVHARARIPPRPFPAGPTSLRPVMIFRTPDGPTRISSNDELHAYILDLCYVLLQKYIQCMYGYINTNTYLVPAYMILRGFFFLLVFEGRFCRLFSSTQLLKKSSFPSFK